MTWSFLKNLHTLVSGVTSVGAKVTCSLYLLEWFSKPEKVPSISFVQHQYTPFVFLAV